MNHKIIFFTLFLAFISCKNTSDKVETKPTANLLDRAKEIQLFENTDEVIVSQGKEQLIIKKSNLPIQSVMIGSSSAAAYLTEIGAFDRIKGVTESAFFYNPQIQIGLDAKTILDVGSSNELAMEVILANKPQLFISSTNPMLAKFHQQLEQNGVQVLYLDEYKEEDPLGRAEYIKLFGKLFGRETLAEQRYTQVSKSYDSIRSILAQQPKANFTTLVNTLYGDVWYLPAVNTLQAKFIEDAQGNYFLAQQSNNKVLNKTFEEVYAQAKDAKYWVNAGDFESLSALKTASANYAWFTAFKTAEIYNPLMRRNKVGANDYYETGVVRPDLILKDLGKIFYPKTFPNTSFYFFKKLE